MLAGAFGLHRHRISEPADRQRIASTLPIMTSTMTASLLLVASVAVPPTGPYKLVITWNQAGIAVVDYADAGRCERARRAVEAEVQRRMRESLAAMPEGARIIGTPANGAFCIPG
jgi:hypothetical protein